MLKNGNANIFQSCSGGSMISLCGGSDPIGIRQCIEYTCQCPRRIEVTTQSVNLLNRFASLRPFSFRNLMTLTYCFVSGGKAYGQLKNQQEKSLDEINKVPFRHNFRCTFLRFQICNNSCIMQILSI